MRILIDIGHPAHVHLFKNFAHEMEKRGHELLFTCRDKEFEIALLEYNKLKYVSFGKKYKSIVGKIWGMFKFDYLEWRTCLRFKPDILLSHGSICAAHAAWLIGKPHIAFEDTFNFEQVRLYKPFTDTILTSDYDNPLKNERNVIQYAGYHELAYFHPNRFTPNKSILKELGVDGNEKYVIIRFVSWNASHDIGHRGISFDNKLKAIMELKKHAKVFVSSEGELPERLKIHQIEIAPHRMHDAMAFASLLLGESSTMSEEAAIMGIPSVYLHTGTIAYTKELEEKYQLIYNYSESLEDQERAIKKGIELLQMDKQGLHDNWLRKRNKLLDEKIDVTAFLVWFIEHYPESKSIMKNNPDYQFNFK